MAGLISKFMMNVIGKSQLRKIDRLEEGINDIPGAIHPTDKSPQRFDIIGEAII